MTSFSTEIKDIRKFGMIAVIFFGCLFMLGVWRQKPVPIYLFGALSLLGLGFILIPGYLTPVYKGWHMVAHFIGTVVTTAALVMAYYVVITPMAFIKRLFGGRPLTMKPDKNSSTYWVAREEPAQPKERFIKRY
jgi:uncharacterized membrane protein